MNIREDSDGILCKAIQGVRKGSVESKEISFYGMNKKMGEECDSDWKKIYICKIFLKMRKE